MYFYIFKHFSYGQLHTIVIDFTNCTLFTITNFLKNGTPTKFLKEIGQIK